MVDSTMSICYKVVLDCKVSDLKHLSETREFRQSHATNSRGGAAVEVIPYATVSRGGCIDWQTA